MNTKKSQTNYSVGDFLIRVKNTAMAGNKSFEVFGNNHILSVAQALKKGGYFDEVKKEKENLVIKLSFKSKKPLVMNIKLISVPGRRIYMGVDELSKKRGPSQYLISTPKGVLLSREAIKNRVGGEVIAEIL